MRVVYNGKTLEIVQLAQLCDKYKDALDEIAASDGHESAEDLREIAINILTEGKK